MRCSAARGALHLHAHHAVPCMMHRHAAIRKHAHPAPAAQRKHTRGRRWRNAEAEPRARKRRNSQRSGISRLLDCAAVCFYPPIIFEGLLCFVVLVMRRHAARAGITKKNELVLMLLLEY